MDLEELKKILIEDEAIRKIIKRIASEPDNNELEELKSITKKYESDLIELFGFEENGVVDMGSLIEKIKEWFRSNNSFTGKLKKNIESLDLDNKNLDETLNQTNRELSSVQNQLDEISNKNIEANKKIEFYENNFKEQLDIYKLYTELSGDTKSSLSGIFKENSLIGFLACGYQESNITSFWDYIKDEIKESKNQDIESLIKIFDFLFKGYSISNPNFIRNEINLGDEFDDDLHIRHSSSSRVNGEITEVMFKGWINSRLDRVLKKSIVKMG
ncbi:MAG: hypothetical protein B6229_04510 [Spirochaetaceae bacterium 4572_7]|nr:MAG: hypothetical protein B6229_04510 [Spirochaetaceae bacterium 4572_7]